MRYNFNKIMWGDMDKTNIKIEITITYSNIYWDVVDYYLKITC